MTPAPPQGKRAGNGVLILGGYGAFGARVAERLARVPGITLTVAGRSREKAEAFASAVARRTGARAIPATLDAGTLTADDVLQKNPAVLINASGPFQEQDYTTARACIAAGVHYIDLADASGFVTGIAALDEKARRASVLVVSGASTVPALSSAVADELAPRFSRLDRIETVISPGNSFSPGLSTTRSILGTLGRPVGSHGKHAVYGWQGLKRRRLPGLGGRWIGHCDAPDRALFPQRYTGLERADVYAALEVGPFHLGLWGLSGLARAGLLPKPERLARPLLAMKDKMSSLGSDRGGMLVRLEGTDESGGARRVDWHLVAQHGHGPYIPATPAVLVAKRLLDGSLRERGAMACMGLFSLADAMAEIADLDISAGVS